MNENILRNNTLYMKIIVGIILFILFFIYLLDLEGVILLNELVTNGKDPQDIYNYRYIKEMKPSSKGLRLPKYKKYPWFNCINYNAIINKLNRKERKLKEKNNKIEFTYSIWIKIFNAEENLNWQTPYDTPKIILNRNYSPILLYIPNSNTFRIGIQISKDSKINFYEIPNFFRLQRWEHLCVVLQERNLDIFLDGELNISYILPSVPFLNNEDIYLYENYGLYAQCSFITYYNRSLDIKEVKKLYDKNKKDKVPLKKNFKKLY